MQTVLMEELVVTHAGNNSKANMAQSTRIEWDFPLKMGQFSQFGRKFFEYIPVQGPCGIELP